MTFQTGKIDALAQKLQSLRDSGGREPTETFGALPDMAEAGAILDRITLPGQIADAWKVAQSPDAIPLLARLHPFIEQTSGASLPLRRGTLLEIEIAVRLGKDLPPSEDKTYQRSDIQDAIGAVHMGAELVRSVIEEHGKLAFPLFYADRLGNDGYILGPEVSTDFLDPACTAQLAIQAGDATIFDAPGRHPTGDVLSWLLAFANVKDRPAASLRAGTLITTGSLCGAIPLQAGGEFRIELAGAPAFSFTVV